MEQDKDYIVGYNKDNEPSMLIFLSDEGKRALANGEPMSGEDGVLKWEYISMMADYKAIMNAEF